MNLRNSSAKSSKKDFVNGIDSDRRRKDIFVQRNVLVFCAQRLARESNESNVKTLKQ